jgi:hypothetical protein
VLQAASGVIGEPIQLSVKVGQSLVPFVSIVSYP